ncbi:MAG: hypothetical protein U9Q96_01170 [Patescibacteria group bacterium]|nr:hypothetical protein [Patescibacteria group bacterium]
MRINFFEEFPQDDSLQKAALVIPPSTIYIGAKSLKEFLDYKKKLYKINPGVEAAYWPILKKSYWISPFSNTKELEGLIHDLKANKQKGLEVLLDLELPFLNIKLFLKNALSFFKNREIIRSILRDANKFGVKITSAEYPFRPTAIRPLGISYSLKKYKHKRIPMYYSSVIPFKKLKDFIKKILILPAKKNTHIGLGIIKKGIFGGEKIITAKRLEKDLEFFKKEAASATIFRLGGLNKEYVEVLKKYQNN